MEKSRVSPSLRLGPHLHGRYQVVVAMVSLAAAVLGVGHQTVEGVSVQQHILYSSIIGIVVPGKTENCIP